MASHPTEDDVLADVDTAAMPVAPAAAGAGGSGSAAGMDEENSGAGGSSSSASAAGGSGKRKGRGAGLAMEEDQEDRYAGHAGVFESLDTDASGPGPQKCEHAQSADCTSCANPDLRLRSAYSQNAPARTSYVQLWKAGSFL
jgi:hypothetical protein